MMQEARLRLAIRLWHRFGNTNVESFDDETHKAEYFDAIDGLPTCLLIRLLFWRLWQKPIGFLVIACLATTYFVVFWGEVLKGVLHE